MSRIIVKNIPKFVTEKELSGHFSGLGEITDSKIARDPNGNSRKFGFIGFKDPNAGKLAKKNFHNTYIGVSKIQVQQAKTRDQEQQQAQKQPKKNKKEEKIQQINTQKFNQYKKLVQEGVKRSWDDLVVGQDTNPPLPQQTQPEEKTKKQKKTSKQKPSKMEEEIESNEKPQTIKAPKLSEKNKKYIDKPLGIDDNRLYVTNIPYNIEEEQIKKAFGKYGNIVKIKLPKEYDGKNKGFTFITYQLPEQAMRAFSETDNKVIFGRILHVKPAVEDIGSIIKNAKEAEFQSKIKQKYGDTIQQKTSFKKKKKKMMRQRLDDTTSWNTLFLNPNTILEYMSRKLKLTKSQILEDHQNLAPKIALAEAQVIQETKQWMAKQKINTEFLDIDRNLCERSEKIVLAKNLNYKVQESEIKELFEFYGIVDKILLAPNRSIAIIEYQNKDYAHNALEKLQNFKFKNNFLMLEMAPLNMIDQSKLDEQTKKIQENIEEGEELSKIIYVKNLNFTTTEESLEEIVEKNVQAPRSVKIIKEKGTNKSKGYGFIQLSSHQSAVVAIKKLQNYLVDGHRLLLSISKQKNEHENFQKIKLLKQKVKQSQKVSNKLVVRNLPFQATKPEIRELFKHFGSLRVVRLPKKLNGQHRGFGFVEYDSAEEAALAKQALSNTHLYGRKLVIEYEKGSEQN